MKELVYIVSYLLCLFELSPPLRVCTLGEALDLLSDGNRAHSGFGLLLLLPSCVLSKASAVYVCLRSYLPRCQTLLSGGHDVCCQSGALVSFTVRSLLWLSRVCVAFAVLLCCCSFFVFEAYSSPSVPKVLEAPSRRETPAQHQPVCSVTVGPAVTACVGSSLEARRGAEKLTPSPLNRASSRRRAQVPHKKGPLQVPRTGHD